jgi:hypothetical protein
MVLRTAPSPTYELNAVALSIEADHELERAHSGLVLVDVTAKKPEALAVEGRLSRGSRSPARRRSPAVPRIEAGQSGALA